MIERICVNCKDKKEEILFVPSYKYKRYTNVCRECRRLQNKARRKRNKQKETEREKRWLVMAGV